jgi:hypothetical protein
MRNGTTEITMLIAADLLNDFDNFEPGRSEELMLLKNLL